jgi:hypothetical protein
MKIDIKAYRRKVVCGLLIPLLGVASIYANAASAQPEPVRTNAGATVFSALDNGPGSALDGKADGIARSGYIPVQAAAPKTNNNAADRARPSSSYMLIPSDTADPQLSIKNGCWVRIYDATDFNGGALTMTGPLAMPNMLGPFGISWKNKVRSIELGKTAILTVYDNENFQQQIARIEPAKKIPDFSTRTGYFDDFSSMKLSCKT